MKKPKLEVQLELVEQHGRRLADPTTRYKALFVFGPTGVGKSFILKRSIGPYIPLQDATRVGMLDMFRYNPNAIILADDYDGIWTDIPILNVLKAALNEQESVITHVNQKSLRDGTDKFTFRGRVAGASNHEVENLPAKYLAHFEALTARSTVIHLTRAPGDLLEFIDWRVCELDHFRSEQFHRDTGITSLGLSAAQDVLDFIHEFAWRLPSISLRMLNTIAIERKRYAEGWHDRVLALLRDKPITKEPVPPAPAVLRWRDRHPVAARPPAARSSSGRERAGESAASTERPGTNPVAAASTVTATDAGNGPEPPISELEMTPRDEPYRLVDRARSLAEIKKLEAHYQATRWRGPVTHARQLRADYLAYLQTCRVDGGLKDLPDNQEAWARQGGVAADDLIGRYHQRGQWPKQPLTPERTQSGLEAVTDTGDLAKPAAVRAHGREVNSSTDRPP